ncbi:Ethanolamine kinase 1 [Bulinus truncatus]|nr:Ethanolamine kinase 1 [Bulinus truncatus]
MSSNVVLNMAFLISESHIEQHAKTLLKQIRPHWNLESLHFKVFTDGITNKLFGCYVDNLDDMILVRINGKGSEIIINREEELENFKVLSEAGCAPPIYCTFSNGMAYGFFPGVPLDECSVREPKIQSLIAQEMVRMHKVQGSFKVISDDLKQSQYKERVSSWLDTMPLHYDDPLKQNIFEKEIPPKIELIKELDDIVKQLEELNMENVFSHNDLLLKNIIYNEKEDRVHFIDYEYAFYNYEAFDIGNHFAEYAGMDNVNYDLYPNREEQLAWLRYYLEYKAVAEGRFPESVTNKDLEILYVQTNKCACAAHFFWTIWSLIQAKYSVIKFNYVQYASTRLAEYYRRKKEFFPLCIAK